MATKVFNGLAQFAKFTATLSVRAEPLTAVTAETVARMGYERAKALYGDKNELAALSETTQALREKAGFTADEPLYASGKLKNELEFESRGNFAGYGSSDPVQLYHELGYVNFRTKTIVPPRPVLRKSVQDIREKGMAAVSFFASEMLGINKPGGGYVAVPTVRNIVNEATGDLLEDV